MILYRGSAYYEEYDKDDQMAKVSDRAQLADTSFTKVGNEHVHCGNDHKPATLTMPQAVKRVRQGGAEAVFGRY